MDKRIETLIDTYAEQFKLNLHYISRYKTYIDYCLINNINKVPTNYKKHSHHIFPKAWSKRLGIPVINDDYNLIDFPFAHHVVAHHILAKTNDNAMMGALKTILNRLKIEYLDFDTFLSKGSQKYILEQAYDHFIRSRAKAVINLNTGEIYKSGYQADRSLGICPGSIAVSIKSQHQNKDCYWAYVKDVPNEQTRLQLLEQYKQQKLQGRKRSQQAATNATYRPIVNLNTGETFKSITDAQKSIDTNSCIGGAMKAKCKAGGYYWAYKEDVDKFGREALLQQYQNNKIENAKKDYLYEPIVNLTTGEEFESIAEATEQVGCAKASISRSITLGIKVRDCYFVKQSTLQQSGLTRQQYLEKLIDQTNQRELDRQKKHWKPVINLDTLQTYPSARHLELAKQKTNSTAAAAIRNHRLYCGEKWVWLEDYQQLGLQACLQWFNK